MITYVMWTLENSSSQSALPIWRSRGWTPVVRSEQQDSFPAEPQCWHEAVFISEKATKSPSLSLRLFHRLSFEAGGLQLPLCRPQLPTHTSFCLAPTCLILQVFNISVYYLSSVFTSTHVAGTRHLSSLFFFFETRSFYISQSGLEVIHESPRGCPWLAEIQVSLAV